MVGQADTAGHLTGPCLAYIYPDHSTALLGQFSDGVMISGREHVVVGLKEDSCGVKVPVFDKSPTDHLHKRQIGCYNYICDGRGTFSLRLRWSFSSASDPTVPDPYECQQVEVLQSQIPGACEGLFAKVDIETGTTVAFYNGSRADPNEFDPESWETNNYRYSQYTPHTPHTRNSGSTTLVTSLTGLLTYPGGPRTDLSTAPAWHTSATTASLPTLSSWCSTIPSLV